MVTAERLSETLAQGVASGTITQEEAETLCAEFPYFQTAQLINASLAIKNAGRIDAAANAVLVSDRAILYSAVYGAPSGYEESEDGLQDEEFLPQESAQTLVTDTTEAPQHDEEVAEEYCDAEENQAYGEDLGEMHAQGMPTDGVDAAEALATTAESETAEVATQAHTLDAVNAECDTIPDQAMQEQPEAAGEIVAADGAEVEEAQGLEQKDAEAVEGREVFDSSVASEGIEEKGEAFGHEAEAEVDGVEEERASEAQGESSDEAPTIDLHGVLEQALSQEVPEMAPSISPFGTVGFNLTQQDIDYINDHLNPRNAGVSSADADSTLETGAQSQTQRIDSFIENFDNILSKVLEEERKGESQGEEPSDLAESQGRLDSHIASERLAFLLAEKGEYDVAIQMYERLGAQNPEKSSYFAEIIAGLNARKGEKK